MTHNELNAQRIERDDANAALREIARLFATRKRDLTKGNYEMSFFKIAIASFVAFMLRDYVANFIDTMQHVTNVLNHVI